jgi:ribosomal protein L37AE/L43A
MRHKCVNCGKMTENYQRINGGPWHCYDGCFSTTGRDSRTIDGTPLWKGGIRHNVF